MEDVPFSGIREVVEECSRLEAAGRDVVHLEIGRPDFDTPEPIKAAAVDALDRGEVHYTSNYGIEPLRRGIAEKLRRDNGLEYDPDGEVIVTAGATEAVFCTVVALVDPGEEVLVPDPGWTYRPAVEVAGATPVGYPLRPGDGFQPDLDALAELVSPDTSLLVVNTPQNPTGAVVDRAHAAAIRDLAVEHDLTVLSDEIYERIIYGREHLSLGALDGMAGRTVTVNGFSKAYSMTGWRLGYLAAPAALADPIVRLRQYTSTCAPSISQHAGVRALEGELHEPLVAAFEERRDLVADRIADVPGMECPTPAGAFYAFPTVPAGVADETEFVYALLREAGVATVPGTAFGETGAGRFRLAYSNSTERIETAFDRIDEWVADR
jgi:aspartate aminotransferase/aminotransferase